MQMFLTGDAVILYFDGINVKTLKTKLPYEPAISLLGTDVEKTITEKIYASQCSLYHYLQ